MARTNKAVCPHCGKGLKSARGIRVGKTIHCLACGVPFAVPADGDQPAAAEGERPGSVNAVRLAVVLLGGLLYLLVGAALALYCFSLNARHPESGRLGPSPQADKEDDNDEPPLPPRPAATALVSAEEQRKLDDAVARGVWYLKDHALPSGTWDDALPDKTAPVSVGFASLPGLSLLECGVPAADPVVQKAAAAQPPHKAHQ
jgi:hypothetical protein